MAKLQKRKSHVHEDVEQPELVLANCPKSPKNFLIYLLKKHMGRWDHAIKLVLSKGQLNIIFIYLFKSTL